MDPALGSLLLLAGFCLTTAAFVLPMLPGSPPREREPDPEPWPHAERRASPRSHHAEGARPGSLPSARHEATDRIGD